MKKEDFVKGKWYTSTLFSHTKGFKFSHFYGGKIVITEIINQDKFSEHITNYEFNNTFIEVPLDDIIQFLPNNHEDVILYRKLKNFPKEGFCRNSEKIYYYIRDELKYVPYREKDRIFNRRESYIKWTLSSDGKQYQVLFLSSASNMVPEYKLQTLIDKIENPNTNLFKKEENERQEENPVVRTTTSEIRNSARSGTVGVRCAGQQIAIRGRSVGNPTSVIKTEAKVVRTEIIPKTGQRRYP
jgi:hypothetical protein